MAEQMRRRAFITLLGGAAAAWPLPARAQQASVPVVGSLNSVSPTEWAIYMTGFRKGLSQMGFGEGKNVSIEYRWAEGQYDRLPAMATDLIKRNVNVIFASGGPQVARAAKAATATVPIVFTVGNDPVGDGLVAGMNRPGGNATGVSHLAFALGEKRFELMTEMIPTARIFALVANPDTLPDQSESKEIQAAAIARGRTLHLLWARTENEIESVFAEIAKQRPDAIIVSPDPFLNSRREQLIANAARLSIPAMYAWREYVDNNGLMSYGASLFDQYRLAGIYVGRILKGEKPADLPVMQPTRFELVINLKTAKTLGLEVPPTVLARADEVIE